MSNDPNLTTKETIKVTRLTRITHRINEWRTPLIALLGVLLSIVLAFFIWEVMLTVGPDTYNAPWIYPAATVVAIVFGLIGALGTLLWAVGKAFAREEDQAFKSDSNPSTINVSGSNASVTINTAPEDEENNDSPHLIEPDAQDVMLRRIYSHGIAQARVSFFVSIIFSAIGSAVLLYGVWQAVTHAANNGRKYAAIVTQTSGVVIDVLAGVFFLQSNRARKDMGNQGVMLREDSRSDRRLNAAGVLVEGISDSQIQNDIRARMAIILVDSDATPLQSSDTLGTETQDPETDIDDDGEPPVGAT